MQGWLERVAADSPGRALELFFHLNKFALPELKAIAVNVRNPTRNPRELSIAELRAILADDTIIVQDEDEPLALPAPASHAGLV